MYNVKNNILKKRKKKIMAKIHLKTKLINIIEYS